MSLKAFHIFFIVMAALSMAGFGVWALRGAWLQSSPVYAAVAALAALATVALLIYGFWFLRKLKHVSYL